jgi:PEP-CTERM motif
MKFKLFMAVAAAMAIAGGFQAQADVSEQFSISVPNFLIPLDNKSATLDVYTDGRDPATSGYDVLGNQRVFVPANGRSAGSLTLNLHLPGADLGEAGGIVQSAMMQFSVRDLDFEPDQVYPGVFLTESASLTSINGVRLQQPVNFMDLVPRGAKTDNALVALNPLILDAATVPWVDFSQPYVLSFTFTAEVTSRGVRAYNINNAAEGIANSVNIIFVPLDPIPEPTTLALMGIGSAFLLFHVLRRRRNA